MDLFDKYCRLVRTGKYGIAVLFVFMMIALLSGAVEIEETVSINKPNMDHPGFVHFSTEYVHCFCNLPSCVATSYMCKSSAGGCFSDLLDQDNPAVSSKDYRGIHGCIELLTDRDQKKWCQSNPNSPTSSTYRRKNHPKSLLLCCYHDMCNHADIPATKILFNDTTLSEINENDNRLSDSIGTKQDPVLYTESEVWFRAATIAVPICGAVILLALIILAIRLLRNESSGRNSSNKLGVPPYTLSSDRNMSRHHNFIMKDPEHNPPYANDMDDIHAQSYLPLLNQKEPWNCDSNSKNETNAKLNFIQDFEYNCLSTCDNNDSNVSPEFYKNTDLHIGRNIILGDDCPQYYHDTNLVKIYNKDLS